MHLRALPKAIQGSLQEAFPRALKGARTKSAGTARGTPTKA